MRYKKLCKEGPEVSVISYGAWGISGRDWGSTDDSESLKAIHKALDCGINLIDTADVYGFGHSDELIKKVLDERKGDDVFIATKAGNDFYSNKDDKGDPVITPNYDKEYIISAVEKSLKRLGRDTIDLLQFHSPDTETLKKKGAWEALEALKKAGKIRFAGLSVRSFKENEQTQFVEKYKDLLDVLQVRYNLLERSAEEKLFPAAQKHGIGIIARIPLLFGFLTGKFTLDTKFSKDDHRRMNLSHEKLKEYFTQIKSHKPLLDAFPDYTMAQVSLAAAIAHPAVSCAIPGGKTPDQVEENCKAADIDTGKFSHLFK